MSRSHKTIGLLGGSFNPPHLAHVLMGCWALAMSEVEEVWVIPTGGHPFGKALAPFEDRLEMCRRAFGAAGYPMRVVDVEREPRTHFSIETLERLAAAHPENRWRWILGSDTLPEAHRWRRFDDLVKLAPPLVVPRQGYPVPAEFAGSTGVRQEAVFALPDLSSTLIRDHLKRGADDPQLAGILTPAVLEFIRERKLYAE